MNYEEKATTSIHKHRLNVIEGLRKFVMKLVIRGQEHDMSKFMPVELGPLTMMEARIEEYGPAPFGTQAYRDNTRLLGPMLEHHYANNRHHPEHFEAGIHGMNLVDIVEMVCDWHAAADRNGDPEVNLTYCFNKYGMGQDLQLIIINTFESFDWKWK